MREQSNRYPQLLTSRLPSNLEVVTAGTRAVGRAVFRMGNGLMAVALGAPGAVLSLRFHVNRCPQRAGEDLMSQGFFSVARRCWPPERRCPQA
jgi:hypothetical protein